jgi:hypothetical protein
MDIALGQYMGTLVVSPLSSLTTAQASTAQVYVNTYISTDVDAEFFMLQPSPSTRKTYIFPAYPGPVEFTKEGPVDMEEEIGNGGNFVFKNRSHHLGDNLTGESIRSVKDIIQRATIGFLNGKSHRYKPAAEYLYTIDNPVGMGFANLPLFQYFSFLYRFRSGGLYITFPRLELVDIVTFIDANSVTSPVIMDRSVSIFNVGSNDISGFAVFPSEKTAPFSLKIPYYSQLPYVYNNVKTTSGSAETFQVPSVVISSGDANVDLEPPFISAADDFNLYKLFAPPTLFQAV